MGESTTVTLYCINDGCDVKSQRYEVMDGIPQPNRCPECGGPLSTERPRAGQQQRGPRRFDTY